MPGPIIHAERGQQVTVDWVNRLPAKHRLAIDHTLDGAGKHIPEVRSVVHLHGGHVASESDGNPESWVVPGQQQHTVYPNNQPAATLWYHDHSMGVTRLNALMGLAGIYLLHDPDEDSLRLPSGKQDVPLILQDRILDARGQLVYPVSDDPQAPWVPEFFGTHVLVNGRVWPYLEVEPRRYRFRILNASNSRVFQLSLSSDDRFLQIASDGGLLAAPAIRRSLLIAPGERIEAVVDFSGREGRRIVMANDAPAPYMSGGALIPRPVIQFRVTQPLTPIEDSSQVPLKLASLARLEQEPAMRVRRLALVEEMGADGRPIRSLLDGKRYMDPVSESSQIGSTEVWEFLNTTMDAHPIHLHAIHFQALDRQPFNVPIYQQKGQVVFTKDSRPAPLYERGWKDTILCPPGELTRIIVPFEGEPGRYVWHCHMLEHEDKEMMRPLILKAR